MSKRKLFGLIAILLILGISNIYSGYINIFTEGIGKRYHFQTESGDFEFTAIPSKGRDTKMMMRQYENHIKEKGTETEEIYRTFRGNPLKFWNWYTYSTNELYQFDYKKSENKN
jgi:hypothetical protein